MAEVCFWAGLISTEQVCPGATVSIDLLTATDDDSVHTFAGLINTEIRGGCFSSDGLSIYLCGTHTTLGTGIAQYNLSVAGDPSTAGAQISFLNTHASLQAWSCWISPDDSNLYVARQGSVPLGTGVKRYNMSTPKLLSSATQQEDIILKTGSRTTGVCLSEDGTSIYLALYDDGVIEQRTLTVPYILGASSFVANHTPTYSPFDIDISSDGSTIYSVGQNGSGDNYISQHDLSTNFAISSATESANRNVDNHFTAGTWNLATVFFGYDDSDFFAAGYANYDVYQYTFI